MKIEVTQEDIDRGVRGSYVRCPVALALKRAAPFATHSGIQNAHFLVNGQRLKVKYPPEVDQFIENFDLRRQVKPFTFELSIEFYP